MSEPVLLLLKLTEMRQWASEQTPPVRARVQRLCDALEDCAKAAHDARLAVSEAQRLVAELRASAERMAATLANLRSVAATPEDAP